MNDAQGFRKWFDGQKRNHGLVDIKFCTRNISEATKEAFLREAFDMISAFEEGKIEDCGEVF